MPIRSNQTWRVCCCASCSSRRSSARPCMRSAAPRSVQFKRTDGPSSKSWCTAQHRPMATPARVHDAAEAAAASPAARHCEAPPFKGAYVERVVVKTAVAARTCVDAMLLRWRGSTVRTWPPTPPPKKSKNGTNHRGAWLRDRDRCCPRWRGATTTSSAGPCGCMQGRGPSAWRLQPVPRLASCAKPIGHRTATTMGTMGTR